MRMNLRIPCAAGNCTLTGYTVRHSLLLLLLLLTAVLAHWRKRGKQAGG